jgi:hypothetical protein
VSRVSEPPYIASSVIRILHLVHVNIICVDADEMSKIARTLFSQDSVACSGS